MLEITDNLSQICDKIARLALQNDRRPDEICLIAVSKTQPIKLIAKAYTDGQRDFAENYLQEAEGKIALAKSSYPDICWHFIGQIQTNKCKRIAENFDWVHSLSSLKHAQKLNDARPSELPPLNVLLQISLEEKAGRNGIEASAVASYAATINKLKNLRLRGLMCVLPVGYDQDQAYLGFMQIRQCYDKLKQDFPMIDKLSIGMSTDYPEAIRAGANMLRIGSAIFGQRNYPAETNSKKTGHLHEAS